MNLIAVMKSCVTVSVRALVGVQGTSKALSDPSRDAWLHQGEWGVRCVKGSWPRDVSDIGRRTHRAPGWKELSDKKNPVALSELMIPWKREIASVPDPDGSLVEKAMIASCLSASNTILFAARLRP